MKITITGGRLIDPANGIDGVMELHLARGRIAGVGQAPEGFTADRTLDASGRWVCPGFVDLAVRLREPGQEHKANIASETRAAAASGVTTLCCPPDTQPVMDTPAVAELVIQTAEAAGHARALPVGGLTRGLQGDSLSEMAALKAAGCVAVSNVLAPLRSSLVLRRAMEYAADQGLVLFIHPQDPALSNNGCAHEGKVSTRMGLPGIPAEAETTSVTSIIALAQDCGARVHFCRLSTAQAVHMISRARYDGVPVTADVAAHQLFLTEHDILKFNSQCHVLPPLRSDRDRDGLRSGLASGSISAICSDHQPHNADAKLAPFPSTEPGISALETLLPLTLRLVEDGVLSETEAIACLTSGPASVLALEAGQLGPGSRADVCIVDPGREWVLCRDTMLSRGRNTPFLDWHLKGRVSHTFLGGRLVYENPD